MLQHMGRLGTEKRKEKEKKEKKQYEDKRFHMVRVIATLPSGLPSPPPGKRSRSLDEETSA